MFIYTLLYFDKFGNYLGQLRIISPGAGCEAVRELIKEKYWQEPGWGCTPDYVIAVPVDHGGDPVMVVK